MREAGTYVFMHSDGYIRDIYQDLIEIGINAINSQLFCMPIEEIGKKFAGKITFGGEIDRQRIPPFGTEEECPQAVRRGTVTSRTTAAESSPNSSMAWRPS